MAKTDWSSVAAQYQSAYAKTGISPKAWCEQQGMNYQSARRYIKFRTAQTAHSDVRNAQSAQSKVRTIAHSEKNAQPKGNEAKARGGEGGEKKSSSPPHASADSGQKTKNKGRDDAGRFVRGEYEGNPNPQANIKPGMQIAKTHGGYAQFLDADELFDQAEELRLRDELIFTRARVISVTKTLKALQHDLAEAQELADRLALYDKILRAEQALDRNIQRIESIERTLSALRIDEVSGPKIEADTKRIKAATRKLTAEADLLEKDGGADTTPVAEMTAELQELGTGGLMS
ncbi:terminase [Aeromonas allosaccharophila]|uniref:terminase n=1 Tax=Aeromonas allosaccharophila TaxID=656 RepID=UPI002ADFF3B3|nr:terminase [Aeromonas allosaccharophila]